MVADINDPQTQADAAAMNNALIAHGYKQSDQPLYMAFQRDAELTPDGFPGQNTMKELGDVLFAMHVTMANVPIYPWLAAPGYDGKNAPTSAQWYGTSAPTTKPSTSTSTTTTTSNASFLSSLANLSGGTKALLVGAAVLAVGYAVVEAGHHPIGKAPHRARRGMQHHARRLTRHPTRHGRRR